MVTIYSVIDEKSRTVTTTYGNNDVLKALYSKKGLLLSQSLNDTEQYTWQYNKSGKVYKYTDKVNNLYSEYDYDTMSVTFHKSKTEELKKFCIILIRMMLK